MNRENWLRRQILTVFLLVLVWMAGTALPAVAAQCPTVASQEVCILNLRRSAKNYWEYWALLSINGVKQPERVYDCRVFAKGRSRNIPSELTAETVKSESIGSLVCRLYRP
jgi:hypothetical protein